MKKLIVANWKMNPESRERARRMFARVRAAAAEHPRAEVVVCPPCVFLGGLRGESVSLGAQDVFYEEEGAYTGEISVHMLADLGVRYVLVGHSERRALGETDGVIQKKLVATLKAGLHGIFCVGETARDEQGAYLHAVEAQLEAGLRDLTPRLARRLVIAYEPVWAIGEHADRVATPDEFFSMSILIRKVVTRLLGKRLGADVPVLYGGSASRADAREFLSQGGAQGLLVGRASLDTRDFAEVIAIAESV